MQKKTPALVLFIIAAILAVFCKVEAAQLKVIPLLNEHIKNTRIHDVACENDTVVWGTDHGVVLQKGEKIEFYDSSNSPLKDIKVSAVGVCDGKIWIAQSDHSKGYGIFELYEDEWKNYRKPETEGILNNQIVRIHVDQDKKTWFGYYKYGIGNFVEAIPPRFASKKVLYLFKYELLSLFMQQTHLWIGSTNGIVRYRTEIPSKHYLNFDKWVYPEFPAVGVFAISDYGIDNIVAGTDRGLALWNGKKWTLINKKKGLLAIPVQCIVRIGNVLWLGGYSGLQRWTPTQQGLLLTEKDGLPSTRITCMTKDKNNNLLVGTEKGAVLIKTAP